jgi:hypothetical protein
MKVANFSLFFKTGRRVCNYTIMSGCFRLLIGRPFQGGLAFILGVPGLKPWAESFRPFGTGRGLGLLTSLWDKPAARIAYVPLGQACGLRAHVPKSRRIIRLIRAGAPKGQKDSARGFNPGKG